VGFVEYLSNPHLPECLHLNNLTGKPAAIVVNPSGRLPNSVEPAERLLDQDNFLCEKKILLFIIFSIGKIVLFIFSQDQNQQT
jgi:hypothetical protein